MKIREAIDKADGLKPNQFSEDLKVGWLNQLDIAIYNDIILTHNLNEGEELPDRPMYSPDNTDKEMLVPFPYDEVYVYFLKLKVDEENEETARYNNSLAFYQAAYNDYAKYYNKTHYPKGKSEMLNGKRSY